MKSIRTKLIGLIALLMIIAFSATGYILIDRKTKELTADIYRGAVNFAELTAAKVADTYRLNYVSQGFAYFNRDMSDIFSLNTDITGISVVSYQGELAYDSQSEKSVQYSGPKRLVEDAVLITRTRDVKPSLVTTNGAVIYLMKQKNGQYAYVDGNEKSVQSLSDLDRIRSLVFPADDELRIVYSVSYANLDKRIQEMMISMLLLLLFSAVAGILVASVLASRLVKPINTLREAALEISKGNLNIAVQIKTKDELKLLGDTFNTMAKDLHKSTQLLVEKERMGKELEIARNIQMNLLPTVTQIPGLDVAAGVVPALEVGGDCFDFIRINNEQYLMYVGDVTGHGVPSGLVVSMANSLIYAYSNLLEHTRDILIQTNRILKMKTAKDMFITMVMAKWDVQKSELRYTQAGHDPVYVYRAGELRQGPKGGIALGLVDDISHVLKEETIPLQAGDVVIMYTDGFPESFRSGANNKREILGFERYHQIIATAVQLPTAKEIYNSIIDQTRHFMGEFPQFDDMTLVVLKKT